MASSATARADEEEEYVIEPVPGKFGEFEHLDAAVLEKAVKEHTKVRSRRKWTWLQLWCGRDLLLKGVGRERGECRACS